MTAVEFFTAEDGSAWWQRNRHYLTHDWLPGRDMPIRLIEMYDVPLGVTVEVGCAAGTRLAFLASTRYMPRARRAIGVDISADAIAEGRRRYPDLELRVADANHLPVADNLADCLILFFVCHWIPRDMLPIVFAEADRVLKPGGALVIGDFAPDVPLTVPYKHREGVWTYKRPDNYAGLFTATGRYREVARLTWDHDTHEVRPDVPSEQRAGCSLLRKER